MSMLDKANKIADEIVRLRRDIHAHPELGFQETRTSALVADTLREIGIEVEEGVGRTGVIGTLGTGEAPVIGIRADMDALPINEKPDSPYKSTNAGVMHACGHDSHTAMLLGAAHLLKQSMADGDWKGTVKFLFQPSEEWQDENGISGATAMIQDNALDGIDNVIALHVSSTDPAGQCKFSDEYSMAAVDQFEGWINATGGHGAAPHKGTDAVYMSSFVLSALYGIPSRVIDPLYPCVVSVGQIHAGSASNIIPGQVYVQGTIRSFAPHIREELWEAVEGAFKIVEGFGGSYEFKLKKGYPATSHSAEINSRIKSVVTDLAGADRIKEEPLAFGMGAEDFSYMTEVAPGAMFMLGAAIDDGVVRAHHTDIFDIDESVLPLGAAVLAETARRYVTSEQ